MVSKPYRLGRTVEVRKPKSLCLYFKDRRFLRISLCLCKADTEMCDGRNSIHTKMNTILLDEFLPHEWEKEIRLKHY